MFFGKSKFLMTQASLQLQCAMEELYDYIVFNWHT